MLALVLAAAAASTPPAPQLRVAPARQARAVVQIVRPATIRSHSEAPDDSLVRIATVSDGATRTTARLIEFY